MIHLGRFFMPFVWAFLIFNVFRPQPIPVNYFLYFALGFTIIMHTLMLLMLKATLTQNEQKLTPMQQVRIFLFGAFELIIWQRQQLSHPKNDNSR